MVQTIIVVAVVLAAAAWLVWSLVRRARSGGCGSCATADSCPFASEGVCPSEEAQVPEEEDTTPE